MSIESTNTKCANKGNLIDAIALELNVPQRTGARALDAVLGSIRNLLRERGKLTIKGFGRFERTIARGRAYKHPMTGMSIDVPDREVIRFKPSDCLVTTTRTGTPQE